MEYEFRTPYFLSYVEIGPSPNPSAREGNSYNRKRGLSML